MLVFRAGSDQVTPWDAKNHQYYGVAPTLDGWRPK